MESIKEVVEYVSFGRTNVMDDYLIFQVPDHYLRQTIASNLYEELHSRFNAFYITVGVDIIERERDFHNGVTTHLVGSYLKRTKTVSVQVTERQVEQLEFTIIVRRLLYSAISKMGGRGDLIKNPNMME